MPLQLWADGWAAYSGSGGASRVPSMLWSSLSVVSATCTNALVPPHMHPAASPILQAAAYKTGDFRDYLPPEAGGRAAARPASAAGGAAAGAAGGAGAGTGAGGGEIGVRQGLGHILYVRDSGSEHDSDEDPDDDLDI